MVRVPSPRVSATRRMILGAVVIPLFAVAFIGLLMPSAAAAPAAPYFGPAGIVDQPPAYTAGNPSLAVGSDGVEYLAFAGWAGCAAQSDPALTLDPANNIYIAWTDTRLGTNDIFFSKSTNGGLSFSGNVKVNDFTGNSQSEPDLA